ncbi:MAG TPA: class I SAM-dependent methyltransferase [Bacteroidetes bacterium]|nr:class I SAM-dependent methyltransferase [Bacteroidota bacterium]
MAKIWDNLTMTEQTLTTNISAVSSNQNKHETKNPLRKIFLDNFHAVLGKTIIENCPFNKTPSDEKPSLETVLEVGCGEGFVLDHLSRNFTISTIIGTDISKEALDIAKAKLPQAVFTPADLSSEEFPQTLSNFNQPKFDLVLCLEVLEHITDYEKALQNLANIPAETFIISVPNEPFFRLSNFLALKNIKAFGNDSGHVNIWSAKKFRNILLNYFQVVSCHYPFPWQMYVCKKK